MPEQEIPRQSQDAEQGRSIKIKLRDEDLKGSYSNLMQILHTKEEFLLDFFLVSPPEGILASRIIMSPGHIKRMLKALEENIQKYEEKFGKVEEAASPEGLLGFQVEKK